MSILEIKLSSFFILSTLMPQIFIAGVLAVNKTNNSHSGEVYILVEGNGRRW